MPVTLGNKIITFLEMLAYKPTIIRIDPDPKIDGFKVSRL